MISSVVVFKDSTITQRAAFFRILYGFPFLFLPLFVRMLGLGVQVPTLIFMIPLYVVGIPSINCLTTYQGQPLIRDPSISNWRISISFLMLGKQFFEPSPHSDKISYRVFRGLLGAFTLVVGLLFFILMLPLVALELLTSRGNSVRQIGRYEHFNSNEGNEITVS